MDLKAHNLCIYIFSLNDESPSMLALEEEEELSAANHWLLPAGDYTGHAPFNANHIPLMESFTQK